MSPVCQNATHLVVVLRERRYALITVSWGWSCLLEFGLWLWLGLLHAQLRKLRGIRWIILQRETEKTVPERRVQPGQEAVAAAVVVAGEAEPPTPVQVHLRVPVRQVDASPLEAAAAEEAEEGAAQDSHFNPSPISNSSTYRILLLGLRFPRLTGGTYYGGSANRDTSSGCS